MGLEIVCPICGARFEHPGAESFAFNSYGACPACHGLGVRSEVDADTLVPDPTKTIAQGAVLPWNSGGRRLSMYAAGELGVRLDVPYRWLTEPERQIVLHGEPVRQRVTLHSGRNGRTVQLSVNYDNAIAAVERSLRSDNERTRRLVQRFVITRVCSVCHGTRLRPEALASRLGDLNLADISALRLAELPEFVARLPSGLPAELGRLTSGLLAELNGGLTPLLDVGLGYLTLDRAGASLSTGERQRVELTSTVRASTTGMLYVLDEPSVGLHPINVQGLRQTIAALAGNGNSVVIVEHERDLIRSADWVIELGPGAGGEGGRVIAQGTPRQLETDPHSIIGGFLAGAPAVTRDRPAGRSDGRIAIEIGDLYNLHQLAVSFPVQRLTALAGPSGAGKTALVLDSLIPAARAQLTGSARPRHVRHLELGQIRQVVQIDASPIGQNTRSTPATYSGAFDHLPARRAPGQDDDRSRAPDASRPSRHREGRPQGNHRRGSWHDGSRRVAAAGRRRSGADQVVMRQLLANDVSLIVEANFSRAALFDDLPAARIVQLHVSADPEVLRTRMLERDTHLHPVHYDHEAADEVAGRAAQRRVGAAGASRAAFHLRIDTTVWPDLDAALANL